MNSNRDFKAGLLQVASFLGFLSHFNRNFPSMFYEEAKSGLGLDRVVSDIYIAVNRLLRTFVDTNISDVGDIAVFKL